MNFRVAVLGTGALSACIFAMMAQGQLDKPKADTIFIRGNIYTGLEGGAGRAQAIAVRGERIEAVGSQEDVLQMKGPATVVVDLGGRFMMPGFNDAHLHLIDGGFARMRVDFVGTKSIEDFRQRVRARVKTAAPDEWVLGEGWDETLWPVKVLPNRQDLDQITSTQPIFLGRVDGHIAVANTRALQLAGITISSKDPAGGRIDREADGEPTGILRETARSAVTGVIPAPTDDQRRQAYEIALQELAQWGVTSAQDNSDSNNLQTYWDDFHVLERLKREGKLTARITEWLPFRESLPVLKAHRANADPSDTRLHTGMLKGYMDGSLGSRTAALLAPYSDDLGNSGIPQYEQVRLNEMAKERIGAGFQLGFHAIGDKGVQMALDAFAEAGKAAPTGSSDFRFRIEHAQVTTPEQIAKFRELKVIASMQPCHLLTDMNWAQSRLGSVRAAHSYAWAEFLQKGVTLAFGTDFPVEPVNPFRGLYAAVTRKSEDGTKEYFPEQKLTIVQAIAAYTIGSAFAEFAEKDKGTLVGGKFADFVVLDHDITSVPAAEILCTKVLRTVVGGKTVYEATGP